MAIFFGPDSNGESEVKMSPRPPVLRSHPNRSPLDRYGIPSTEPLRGAERIRQDLVEMQIDCPARQFIVQLFLWAKQ